MGNAMDPHTQIRTTVQPCQEHKKHMPASHINHRHHVWPLGEGGPNVEDNIIVVCATGHMNIHELMKEFKIHMGNPPYSVVRQYALEERKYAELGYKRLTRGEM